MKKFFAVLSLALCLTVLAPPKTAHAAPVSASTFGTDFAQASLTNSWTTLFAATTVVKAVKGIQIFNGSTSTVLLALGAAGLEVTQMEIPPGGSTTVGPSIPVYYPFVASQNQRISISASTGAIVSGKFIATIFYN